MSSNKPTGLQEAAQTKQTTRAKKILVQPDYSIFLFRFEFLRYLLEGYKKIKSKQHLEGEAGVRKAHTPSEKLFLCIQMKERKRLNPLGRLNKH